MISSFLLSKSAVEGGREGRGLWTTESMVFAGLYAMQRGGYVHTSVQYTQIDTQAEKQAGKSSFVHIHIYLSAHNSFLAQSTLTLGSFGRPKQVQQQLYLCAAPVH